MELARAFYRTYEGVSKQRQSEKRRAWPGVDFDAAGHLDMQAIQQCKLPLDGDFYICGPSRFMSDLTEGLTALGVAPDRIHTEMFGAGPSVTPGIAASPQRPPHSGCE